VPEIQKFKISESKTKSFGKRSFSEQENKAKEKFDKKNK